MTAPADIDGLPFGALKALVVQLLNKAVEQERLIAELREEKRATEGSERPTADQAKRHGRRE